MAVRVPIEVDVIESNRGCMIVLAEMQADAVVHNPAISFRVANRIRKPLGRRDHIIKQPNFAQVEIAARVKAKELVPKFFGSEVQNPDLLGHLKTDGVIISLLGGHPRLRENGPCIFAELAQACTSQAGNSAGGARYGAKPVSLAGAHGDDPECSRSLCYADSGESRWRASTRLSLTSAPPMRIDLK